MDIKLDLASLLSGFVAILIGTVLRFFWNKLKNYDTSISDLYEQGTDHAERISKLEGINEGEKNRNHGNHEPHKS